MTFVIALSAFVPGQLRQRHRIAQWYTAKPRLSSTEIRHMKLVGVERDRLNTNVFESHVSVVDLDADRDEGSLMTGGLYLSGVWLEELVAKADEFRVSDLATVFWSVKFGSCECLLVPTFSHWKNVFDRPMPRSSPTSTPSSSTFPSRPMPSITCSCTHPTLKNSCTMLIPPPLPTSLSLPPRTPRTGAVAMRACPRLLLALLGSGACAA